MTVEIIVGDALERLRDIPDNSVDSCATDPPYHLTSIVKRFARSNLEQPADKDLTKVNAGQYKRLARGFMGQTWDGGDIAFRVELWAEVLRVLKPGAHLVAFGGTRTFHRMVTAIEDAGFEIRDSLFYIYGSGFPKSHNVRKGAGEAVCRCPASDGELRGVRQGQGDAVRLVQAREAADLLAPLQRDTPRPGLGEARPQRICGAAADAGYATREEPGMEGRRYAEASEGQLQGSPICEGAGLGAADGESGRLHHGAPPCDGSDVRLPSDPNGSGEPCGPQPGEQSPDESGVVADECGSQARGGWPLCRGCGKPIIPAGLGTALKPAVEPICLARKPLDGTVAGNVLAHGTGALNIDGCRIETEEECRRNAAGGDNGLVGSSTFKIRERHVEDQAPREGRWPANIIHDGSEEVLAGFPDLHGAGNATEGKWNAEGWFGKGSGARHGDSGSAARFFKECNYGDDEWRQLASLGLVVRCADSQCALCGTPTAADHAGTKTSASKSEASQAIPGSIGSCSGSTQTPRHAPDAAPPESIGTIQTIASCSRSNGSARHATAPTTKPGSGERAAAANGPASATRFLYCAKADSAERHIGGENRHPTVKPIDLMRWLCRLVTPKGGLVLDPFAGSGSTLIAADREQMSAIGIELSPEYAEIARQRLAGDRGGLLDAMEAA